VRSIALVGALVAGLGVAGTAGTAAAVPAVPPAAVGATAAVDWGACSADPLAGVPADQLRFCSCARYRVPIDHDDARRGTIDIALLKPAARTPGQRVGSLFLNPGGPGGSGLRRPISGQ
jgi:hypothetical protein